MEGMKREECEIGSNNIGERRGIKEMEGIMMLIKIEGGKIEGNGRIGRRERKRDKGKGK